MALRSVIFWLAVSAAPASADPLRGMRLEGWYGKLGLETGVVFAPDRPTSALLGCAATIVRMNSELEWLGIQADALADTGPAGARWSVGPEAGVAIYGVDVSYFGERLDGATHHGFQARAKLTVGFASVYVRAAYALVGADSMTLDTGLQLKLPVWIRRDRRSLRDAARAAGIARL